MRRQMSMEPSERDRSATTCRVMCRLSLSALRGARGFDSDSADVTQSDGELILHLQINKQQAGREAHTPARHVWLLFVHRVLPVSSRGPISYPSQLTDGLLVSNLVRSTSTRVLARSLSQPGLYSGFAPGCYGRHRGHLCLPIPRVRRISLHLQFSGSMC